MQFVYRGWQTVYIWRQRRRETWAGGPPVLQHRGAATSENTFK